VGANRHFAQMWDKLRKFLEPMDVKAAKVLLITSSRPAPMADNSAQGMGSGSEM